ncbi:DUF421 domain-containing protein [Olivibacter sp. XZL3]|uniref:DUF421 domain-containing protein n=1 Tax=Olivibacter sp. XZL3 TaxID=1735116 RepID=UPI00106588F5|nr:YetF domain-containing protein [Olivibacter sp. XZL3]
MKKEDIQLGDWMRVFIGEAPGVFFIEIILRTIVIYAVLMIAFRLIGSRMATQLSRTEQASLVTLAAAIGVPIQSPERGILPAVIIAIVVVFFGRLIARKASQDEKFESLSQGNIATLIENGVLCVKTIKRATLTRERIFAELRSEQIVHLGQVKRLYIEPNGSFTLIENEGDDPGLSIIPEIDLAFLNRFKVATKLVCANCGLQKGEDQACKNCGHANWIQAVYRSEKEKKQGA